MNASVMTNSPTISARSLSGQVIRRYDMSGPRYTSYPTADRFVEAYGMSQLQEAVRMRSLAGQTAVRPLSVYVHIPFCESLCYYCACNKIITKHHERADEYLQYLDKEIAHYAALLSHAGAGSENLQSAPKLHLNQLHFGGGTPTFLSDDQLATLMLSLKRHFQLDEGGEYAIEVDPRTVNPSRLAHLKLLGFNRLSLGVQDFDAKVQKAVHRVQPFESVKALTDQARRLGFESINMDLIYGLPCQSDASMEKTLAQVVELRPQRIALYAYAHLPERFKPQRRIDAVQLPSAALKTAMLELALQRFSSAGYVYVGMDHFALPNDSLAVAKRQGRLHRNFQGYSTHPDCDLVGLGVSAIGKIGVHYCQNAKSLQDYYDLLDQGVLPVVRGMALGRDDVLRRAVIMSIMCQGTVNYESIELAHLIDFSAYFQQELSELEGMAKLGLIEWTSDGFEVTQAGWYVVRAVAMVFDRYLQADRNRQRYSRII
jgi:oxygen-independent coproporphyrinogen III oxidase